MKFSIPYFPGLGECWRDRPELGDVVEEVYFGRYWFMAEGGPENGPSAWDELTGLKRDFGARLHYIASRSLQHARNLLPNAVQAEVSELASARKKGADRITVGNPLLLNHTPIHRALDGAETASGLLDEIRTLSQARNWVERFGLSVLLVHPDANRNGGELRKIKRYADKHHVRVGLLANEGCLHRCPFRKQEYDMGETLEKLPQQAREKVLRTFSANTCRRIYQNRPEAALQSPFILPEAFEAMGDRADFLRLAGEHAPPDVHRRLLTALLDRATDDLRLYGEYIPRPFPGPLSRTTLNDLRETGFKDLAEDCANLCAECDACRLAYEKITDRA